MATAIAFPAHGRVSEKRGTAIIFKPANTTYELLLEGTGYDGPLNSPVDIIIQMNARKLWTVPSGGNFIEPIFGKPRTIQGRVKAIEGQTLVIQAGLPIHVALPSADSAVDLNDGAVQVGHLVNAMIMPGATYTYKVAT